MDFRAGDSTGIGSLPHREPAAALACVAAATPTFPFWPQLPRRSPAEGMIEQTLGPLCGVPLDRLAAAAAAADPALDDARAAGWSAFIDGFRRRFPQARAIKGQLTGPLTLASALLERAPGPDDEGLLRTLAGWVARCAAWQAERLAGLGVPALVVVDEPCLGLPHGLPEAVLVQAFELVGTSLRAAGGGFGIHCCSPPPCRLLRRVGIELLAFDASRGLEAFVRDPEARALHADGVWVLWGLVPSDGSPFDPAEVEARWGRVTEQQLWTSSRALFGASCGLAGLSISAAEGALRAGRALGEDLVPVRLSDEDGTDSKPLAHWSREEHPG